MSLRSTDGYREIIIKYGSFKWATFILQEWGQIQPTDDDDEKLPRISRNWSSWRYEIRLHCDVGWCLAMVLLSRGITMFEWLADNCGNQNYTEGVVQENKYNYNNILLRLGTVPRAGQNRPRRPIWGRNCEAEIDVVSLTWSDSFVYYSIHYIIIIVTTLVHIHNIERNSSVGQGITVVLAGMVSALGDNLRPKCLASRTAEEWVISVASHICKLHIISRLSVVLQINYCA